MISMRIKLQKDTDSSTDDPSGSDVINCMCVCLHVDVFAQSLRVFPACLHKSTYVCGRSVLKTLALNQLGLK